MLRAHTATRLIISLVVPCIHSGERRALAVPSSSRRGVPRVAPRAFYRPVACRGDGDGSLLAQPEALAAALVGVADGDVRRDELPQQPLDGARRLERRLAQQRAVERFGHDLPLRARHQPRLRRRRRGARGVLVRDQCDDVVQQPGEGSLGCLAVRRELLLRVRHRVQRLAISHELCRPSVHRRGEGEWVDA